jgi:nicotinamidase/pyrazinamidase
MLLIDLQNDFVEGGALAVPQGRDVVSIANQLMPLFDVVVATLDWHPADHKSFASQHAGVRIYDIFDLDGLPQTAWPDHCVAGTDGAALVSELAHDEIDFRVYKGTDRFIDSYSGFYDNGHRKSTGLADLLRSQQVGEVFLMGLATDYCVLYSALDSVREGFKTTVITDGCRGVGLHAEDIPEAWNKMAQQGIELVTSDQVK